MLWRISRLCPRAPAFISCNPQWSGVFWCDMLRRWEFSMFRPTRRSRTIHAVAMEICTLQGLATALCFSKCSRRHGLLWRVFILQLTDGHSAETHLFVRVFITAVRLCLHLLCPHSVHFCWSWSGNTLNSYYYSYLGLMFQTYPKHFCPATFIFNWRTSQIFIVCMEIKLKCIFYAFN